MCCENSPQSRHRLPGIAKLGLSSVYFFLNSGPSAPGQHFTLQPPVLPFTISPLGILFSFCLYKAQEDIKHVTFIKVLRGVYFRMQGRRAVGCIVGSRLPSVCQAGRHVASDVRLRCLWLWTS